jgi:2-oxoglutarate dehydrogenase E1 component
MRIEQFYPVPRKSMMKEMSRFKQAEFVWCQEEPRNMGGWTFIVTSIWNGVLGHINAKVIRPRGRNMPVAAPSASTATGLMSRHIEELAANLDRQCTRSQP